MTYSPYTTVDKIIDSKKEPRDVIKFVNAQISGAFSITINNTNYIADNTFANMVGYVELTNSILNQKIIDNKLKVKIGARDVPFVVVNNDEIMAGTTNKDNFGFTVVYRDKLDPEEYHIRLYTRETLTIGATINISAVILFESYVAHENEDVLEEVSLYQGATNGGGSGSGSGDFEWTYDSESLSVFIDYLKQLIGDVHEDVNDMQGILDALSASIHTGDLIANLVSAGTITTDRLVIESNNLLSEFDSFEEWANKEIPHYVPLYLETEEEEDGNVKDRIPTVSVIHENGANPDKNRDPVLGRWVLSSFYLPDKFPSYKIEEVETLPPVSSANYNTYYLVDNKYYFKKDTYDLLPLKYKLYYSEGDIAEEDKEETIVQVGENFKEWNGSNWVDISVNSYLNKPLFLGDSVNYYFSRSTSRFYKYIGYEELDYLPISKFSYRPTPRSYLTEGERKIGAPWIKLDEGYYILSYYVSSSNTAQNIDVNMNMALFTADELPIVIASTNSLGLDWVRTEAHFYLTGEEIDNLFTLEFNFFDRDVDYYIDGLQIEKISSEGKDVDVTTPASKFARGGKLLFDGSNLITGSVKAEHGVFEIGAIQEADIANAAINSAHIQEAAISSAHIKDASIDNAKINNMHVSKLWAGEVEGETAAFEYITSDLIEVEELSTKILEANEFMAKIGNVIEFTATEIFVDTLLGKSAKIKNLEAMAATFESLKVKEYIDTEKVIATNLIVTSANIEMATLDFANIAEASIDIAKIKNLESELANLGSVMIDDARITNLDVSKLFAKGVEARYADFKTLVTENFEANAAVIDKLTSSDARFLTLAALEADFQSISANFIRGGTLALDNLVFVNPDNPKDSVMFNLNKSKFIKLPSIPIPGEETPRFIVIEESEEETYYKLTDAGYIEITDPVDFISGIQIDGEALLDESLHGNKIMEDSIFAKHINVINLEAISADLGTIDTGKIVGNTNPNFYIDLTQEKMSLGENLYYEAGSMGFPGKLQLKDVDISFLAGANYRPRTEVDKYDDLPDIVGVGNKDTVFLVRDENQYYIIIEDEYQPYSLAQEIAYLKAKADGSLQLDILADVEDPQSTLKQIVKTFSFRENGLFIKSPNQDELSIEDGKKVVELRLDNDIIAFTSGGLELAKFTSTSLDVENIKIDEGEIKNSLSVGSIKIVPDNVGIQSMNFVWAGG